MTPTENMPPAALPGANLLKRLINNYFWFSQKIKGVCDLPRGTRGKTQTLPAFEVAHLAAGGIAFCVFYQHSRPPKALP